MPPVKRAGGIVVEVADDGRFLHTFRQSTVGELDDCPERGRATMAGLMPEGDTDAATVGSAVHHGIEVGELFLREHGYPLPPDELKAVAQGEFTRLSSQPGFTWVKYKEKRARRLIDGCIEVWWDQLYHDLVPVLIEHGFGPIVVYEDESRVIQITGTIDLLDLYRGPGDYKTTGQGRHYRRGFGGEAWQLDRWAIQPTVYCAALRHEGWLSYEGPWPFTFYAFDLEGRDIELIETPVWRRPEDILWMQDKLLSYAKLVEADVEPWPMQDNHALCSPKWCGHWGHCKGAAYSLVEWPVRGPDRVPVTDHDWQGSLVTSASETGGTRD